MRRLNMREQLVKEVEIIPLEVVVRNVAAGSHVQAPRHRGRHGAAALDHRILLQERRSARSLGQSKSTSPPSAGPAPQDLDDIVNLTIRINDFLSGLFLGVGIKLVDFKVEFGRLWENDYMRIVLADEISPDSCRLWDVKTNEKMDKDRFRRDLGGVAEAYSEVARRLGHHAGIDARRDTRDRSSGEMKARVFVTLKNGVLDPQGKAIGHALNGLGFESVGDVRQGKVIDIELAESGRSQGPGQPQGRCARSCSPTP